MKALRPGDRAPSFALLDQHGTLVRLEGFAGRVLLVYFYPEADTPGCTRQSCSIRDNRKALGSLGIDVVGISPDAPSKQLAFDEKYELGFPLLADEDHAVAEAYGAWGKRPKGGEDIIRSSFLVDAEGRISRVWSPVTPEDTVPNALAALAA